MITHPANEEGHVVAFGHVAPSVNVWKLSVHSPAADAVQKEELPIIVQHAPVDTGTEHCVELTHVPPSVNVWKDEEHESAVTPVEQNCAVPRVEQQELQK